MKKYIFKGFIALFTATLMTSCAVDDDAAVVADKNQIITAQTETSIVRIAATETSYDAKIQLSHPVTGLSRIVYTLDGTEMTQDLPEGASDFTIPVDMSDPDTFVRTVTINDFKIINSKVDNVEPEISEDQHTVQIIKGDNTVVFTFTWGDDSDLDCGTIVRVPSLAAVNLSQGLTQPEVAVLPDNAPDGEYFFAILPWTVNNSVIECHVDVLNGTSSTSYSADLVDAQAAGFFGYNTIEDFLKITKTTDAGTGDVSIVIEQVLF